jgi:dethiobiotin synthetase
MYFAVKKFCGQLMHSILITGTDTGIGKTTLPESSRGCSQSMAACKS